MKKERAVIFVGNGRCYHTMDLCRSLHRALEGNSWVFFTDCVESEGHARIVNERDCVEMLLNIDPVLLKDQSGRANRWRNLLKLFLLPLQALLLRLKIGRQARRVIHAHTLYYGLMCRIAGYRYLFTPQGGELTERPFESAFYRRLMRWTLGGASFTFVDSERMRQSAIGLGCEAVDIYQYGIDTAGCRAVEWRRRWRIISNRGIEENYQIKLIQAARDLESPDSALTFFYPLWDAPYYKEFKHQLKGFDEDLGRIPKSRCYEMYAEARLVVSIPLSDSSPRSVYEAIFCGAPVAATASRWVDDLPESMRSRVIVVDPQKPWLARALAHAEEIERMPFKPCRDALGRYDQFGVAHRIYERFYLPVLAHGDVDGRSVSQEV